MKRSKAGIIVLVIGIIILIMAPIFKWVIGPSLVKLPDDINNSSVYEGVMTLYVDPTSMTILPPDMAVKVPLTITRTDQSQPSKSDGSVAVVKETMKAVGPGGKVQLSYTKYFAMDRKKSNNVAYKYADRTRSGYFILLPFNVEKKTYMMWDDDTGKAGPAKFVKVQKMDGDKYKNVDVYVFEAEGSDAMLKPPLPNLPKEITGAEAKKLLGDPNLNLNDDQKYPITYVKSTKATIVADQRTGTIVDLPAYEESYYVDASALGMGKMKIADLKYHQTRANVRSVIDNAAKYYGLLDIAEKWVPLAVLIVGILVILIGILLMVRTKQQEA